MYKRHHATLVDGHSKADLLEVGVGGREGQTGHHSGEEEVQAGREQKAADQALSHRSMFVPAKFQIIQSVLFVRVLIERSRRLIGTLFE